MKTIERILNHQFELHDRRDSYYYNCYTRDEVLEDEKGKYKVKKTSREVPCSCHPETCTHFTESYMIHEEEKVYLKN